MFGGLKMQPYDKHKKEQARLSQENVDKFIAEGGKIQELAGCKLTEHTAVFNKSNGNKNDPDFDTVQKVESEFSGIHKRHFRR